MNEIILNTGDLAYLYGTTQHHSLIKLKVISIEADTRQDGKPVKHVKAKVMGLQVGPFKRGDIVTTESLGLIVPRTAVKHKRGQDRPVILPFTIGE